MDTKNSEKRAKNLELIKNQGTAFMRTLKVQEKGKKKKVFFIRPYINGKPVYVQFNSRAEAEAFLQLLPPSTTNPNKKVFWDYYFTFIQSIKTSNTAKSYWYLKKYLEPISKTPVDQIRKDDLTRVLNGAPRSTWNQLGGVFRGVANLADDAQFYFLVTKFNKDPKNQYISKREDVHNPDEIIKAIMDYKTDVLSEMKARLAFLIICFTGLRVGEFLAMKEEDWINFEIKVSKTVIEEFSLSAGAARLKMAIQENTKGKKDRMVPIEEKVKILVKRYFALLSLHGRLSSHPHRKQISVPLLVIKEKLKLKGYKIDKMTPKTARHIFGTIFGRRAKSMDEGFKLQKMMGHAFFETTEIYITANKASTADIREKFDALADITEDSEKV